MRLQGHKRSRAARKAAAILTALVVGGAGIAAVAASASAGQGGQGGQRDGGRSTSAGPAGWTIACPDAGIAMGEVPRSAESEVGRGLARLDSQISRAYGRLQARGSAGAEGREEVLSRLQRLRAATLERMAEDITRAGGERPGRMGRMSRCEMRDGNREEGRDGRDGRDQEGQEPPQDGQDPPQDGQDPPQSGPVPEDFVDITTVEPNVQEPEEGDQASTGSITVDCGRNENGHFNTDNVITSPGVQNAAQHVHDYVGNLSTDAFSTDESLAAAGTTCSNGDRSTHYWPVLRALDGNEQDSGIPEGAGNSGNVGTILQPDTATITFRGSPVSEVVAMPEFLRIVTGDAKSFTNGPQNANASWSCEGFEDRQLKDKYPLCPDGSDVVRTFTFQSCWDGQNADSGNHRDHVAFAEEDGSCPEGFTAIPQLVQRITYDVPQGEGIPEETPFAVDSFPEQLHKPVTDHSDFINVMGQELMTKTVECINSGRDCG